jgi:pimeloyl-ACP methyl ester carboxylesterase
VCSQANGYSTQGEEKGEVVLEDLACEVVGSASAKRTWVFTHGLLGSGRNWKTFAKNFCDDLSNKLKGEPVRALLVDLRCHGVTAERGEKRKTSSSNTVDNAARDLLRLVRDQLGTSDEVYLDGLVGHSLGGKVAMQYLLHLRDEEDAVANGKKKGKEKLKEKEEDSNNYFPLPRSSTWILDSVPTPVDKGTVLQDTERILQLLSCLDLSRFETRTQVMKKLEVDGVSAPTAMWLCSNLQIQKSKTKKDQDQDRDRDQPLQVLRWKFDLEGAKELFESFQQTDCIDVLRRPPSASASASASTKKMSSSSSPTHHEIHLVRAEKSFRLESLQEKL